MKSFAAVAFLGAVVSAKHTPTAIFHGLEDQCINPGMHNFAREVSEKTGAYAKCVEVGNGAETSLFGNFRHQAEMACEAILANPEFDGEFNVMGLSQGSLLARYIAEECPIKGKIRNYLSIGGPNMGVSDLPGCFDGTLCSYINYVCRNLAYFPFIQSFVGPAGYFRDPLHMTHYLNQSEFLPYLNNEAGTDDAKTAIKDRFTALNAVMLVLFTEDSVVYPKESEWFQQLEVSDMTTV